MNRETKAQIKAAANGIAAILLVLMVLGLIASFAIEWWLHR